MKSTISTLENDFSPEEIQFIQDYIKFVRDQLNYPTKPEILIGSARYPVGRMVLRSGIVPKLLKQIRNYADTRRHPSLKDKAIKIADCFEKTYAICEEIKLKGKTKRKTKRKIYESKDQCS